MILSKLEWAKLSKSERQIRDVAGILRTKGDTLDQGYLTVWVQALNVGEQWTTALSEAGLLT